MRAPVRSQNSLGVKTAQPTSSVNFKSSDLNIISGSTSSNYDHKTFIKICYDENKLLLVNSYCSCVHVSNYIKDKLGLSRDDQIDLMDFEGNLKEIPITSSKQYVIQFVVPTANYIVLKIDLEQNGDKRYYPLIHESKLNPAINKTLSNIGKSLERKPGAKTKNAPPPQLKQGLSTPTSTSSSQSYLNTAKTKSNLNKK